MRKFQEHAKKLEQDIRPTVKQVDNKLHEVEKNNIRPFVKETEKELKTVEHEIRPELKELGEKLKELKQEMRPTVKEVEPNIRRLQRTHFSSGEFNFKPKDKEDKIATGNENTDKNTVLKN